MMSSIGFRSIKVDLIIHGSSFKDKHVVVNDPPKLNNVINTYLNIIV